MKAVIFVLMLSLIFNIGNSHHCSNTVELWNEIRSVLDYKNCNETDPKCLISIVLQRYNANDVYKRLVNHGCQHGPFPNFSTLEEFIAKDPTIELFIANSTHTHGGRHFMTFQNFQQVSALALCFATNLERFVCKHIKDTNEMYAVLGAKHRFDVQHFVNMSIQRYNPARMSDDLIVYSNRLTCLNVDMIESELRQGSHSEHEHSDHEGSRDDGTGNELPQTVDDVFVENIIISPMLSEIEKAFLDADHLDKLEQEQLQTLSSTSSLPDNGQKETITGPTGNQDDYNQHHTQNIILASTAEAGHHFHRTNTPLSHEHHNRLPLTHHRKQPIDKHELYMRQRIDSVSSILVSAILGGITIYPDRRSCMVDHLDYIMNHYGNHRKVLDETGLENLKMDISSELSSNGNKKVSQENWHGKHSSHESWNRHQETNCRKQPAVHDHFVNTDSTGNHLHSDQVMTSRDIFQLQSHNGNHVTRVQFLDICPSILYSLVHQTKMTPTTTAQPTQPPSSTLETYGLGTVSVLVISMCSLFGAVFVKCTKKLIKDYAMGMMLSLSVGCLVGDAVLHLIPEILIKEEEEETSRVSETLTKQCALLASIHGFFLLELLLCLLKTNRADKESYNMSEMDTEDQQNEENEHHENNSLVWMVVIGDAIHNFADGLAIGAAFSKNTTVGFSTSIAVFCHELPHELGDFAALVSTGMSIKKAMFWNFISSLTALAGLYIGILASSNEVARSWIFSAGAGMFIYVALSNLVPEVQSYLRKVPNVCMFLSLNLGLLLGYVSMLLLAIFENDIRIT